MPSSSAACEALRFTNARAPITAETGHSAAAQSDNGGLTRDQRITSHSDYSRTDSVQPSQELIAGVSSLIF
jgi:hypothetical protein